MRCLLFFRIKVQTGNDTHDNWIINFCCLSNSRRFQMDHSRGDRTAHHLDPTSQAVQMMSKISFLN